MASRFHSVASRTVVTSVVWRWSWLGLVTSFLLLLLLQSVGAGKETDRETMLKLVWEQTNRIRQARANCMNFINTTTPPTDGLYCEAVFDNVQCWNYTLAGTVASKPCPAIIVNFNPTEISTRVCQDNGTWGPPPPNVSNSTLQNGWTNYSACPMAATTPLMPRFVPGLIKEHIPVITQISRVGYSVSLVSLVVATFIMVKFKRLHCQRNVIHINLFVTFILRAVICLLRDSLLVQGLGLPQDVQYDADGDIEFNPNGPHWECKLLFTLFHWALSANYMWIFVEGLYLHTLIFFAVFDQKAIFKWYIVIGWVTPFVFVITWVFARIFLNNTLCWNTHERGYYWILNGPIIATICVNFFFFLNIMRALYTKLTSSGDSQAQRYKKLAKSTLVLLPLFGVYYIFFIVITNQIHSDPRLTVGIFYSEMTLNSFQGMVVAILFCFTNGEVRAELKKKWNRQMLRRQSAASLQSSRAMSTTSFFLGGWRGDRQSISGPGRRGSKFPNVDSCVSLRSMETGLAVSNGLGPEGKAGVSGEQGDRVGGVRFPATQSSPSLRGIAEANGEAVPTSRGRGGGTHDPHTLQVSLVSSSSFSSLSPPLSSPSRNSRSPSRGRGGGGKEGGEGSRGVGGGNGEDEGSASKGASWRFPAVDSTPSLRSMDSNGSAGGVVITLDGEGGQEGGSAASAAGGRGAAAADGSMLLSSGAGNAQGRTRPRKPKVTYVGLPEPSVNSKEKNKSGLGVNSKVKPPAPKNLPNGGPGVTETTPMLEEETFNL